MAIVRLFFIAFARFSAMIVFMRNILMMWVSVRIVMNMFIFVVVYFFCMLWMNMRNDRFWVIMILTIFRRINMRFMTFAIHLYILLSLHFIDSLVHYAEKLKPDCISTYTLSLFSPVHFLKTIFGKSVLLHWSIGRLNTLISGVKKDIKRTYFNVRLKSFTSNEPWRALYEYAALFSYQNEQQNPWLIHRTCFFW